MVARIWPLERTARFSKPLPLTLNSLCTRASTEAVGGNEVTDGWGGLVTGIIVEMIGATNVLSTNIVAEMETRMLSRK